MSSRQYLPQLRGAPFLTDGGIETTLIYDDGLELPEFAAFHLLADPIGTEALTRYFTTYARLAVEHGVGVVLETPTWRASADWGARLGYSVEQMVDVNRAAVQLVADVRARHQTRRSPIVVSGCIGPRGDGYDPGELMTAAEARAYHSLQARTLVDAGADMIGAITINNVGEAIGIAGAARDAGAPVSIAFTVETDGALPTGQSLADAIREVDDATHAYPAYFQIGCAHPTHFEHVLEPGAPWMRRIRGLKANASTKSHAELDESTDLDPGDPEELARQYAELRRQHPELNLFGGCCGTNHVHIDAIARACLVPATA